MTIIKTPLLSAVWTFVFLAGVISAVLIPFPQKTSCKEYSLFDSDEQEAVPTKDGSYNKTAEYYSLVAQRAVHDLNARSNNLFKFILVRVISQRDRKEESGEITFKIHQAESQCRNDGKPATSLVQCPLKQNGLVRTQLSCAV